VIAAAHSGLGIYSAAIVCTVLSSPWWVRHLVRTHRKIQEIEGKR
jgi:hypothetical protein